MKRQIFSLFTLLLILGMFAACKRKGENESAPSVPAAPKFTHYVSVDLRLRAAADAGSAIVFTLPQYTAVNIVQEGRDDVIDGTSGKWLQVASQVEITGWCFGAYVKPIEDNIAKEVAAPLVNGSTLAMISRKRDVDHPPIADLSLDNIKKISGYYIQSSPRPLYDRREPEIFHLLIQGERACVDEIDIVDGKRVIRDHIRLERKDNGVYAQGKISLELNNGYAQIVRTEQEEGVTGKVEDKEYRYSFAGSADSMPDSAKMLTSDYLKTFAGTYAFDSFELIKLENMDLDIDLDLMKKAAAKVTYDQRKRWLYINADNYLKADQKEYSYHSVYKGIGGSSGFVETRPDDLFIWSQPMGAGYSEDRAYFYKGGIVFVSMYDLQGINSIGEPPPPDIRKYVIFFKKR